MDDTDAATEIGDEGFEESQSLEVVDKEGGEWPLIKATADVYSYFSVEFLNKWKTDNGKCPTCVAVVRSINFGTRTKNCLWER